MPRATQPAVTCNRGRAGVIATLAVLLAIGLTAIGTGCRKPRVAVPVRNLVVICIDTLRADHVGAWGYERATTPAIDALARRGVRFANAFSTSSWTVPSVASILTSLPPALHGAGVFGQVRQLSETQPPHQVSAEIPMLAQHVSALGYRTALFSANPFLYGRFKDGFETAVVDRVDATRLTDSALEWLAAPDARPRFLYLQYMDLHQPNRPPDPYFQYFPARDGQPHELRHGDWSYGQVLDLEDPEFQRFRDHRIALYDGALRYTDAQIARLLERLDEPPYAGQTLVVLTADHGEEFWDHALEEARHRDDPRGFWGVGHGHTLYQEQLHVPLIASGGPFTGGAVDPCLASLLDIAPTLLSAAGLAPLPRMHGRPLAQPGERAADARCPNRALGASSTAYGPETNALRIDNWKLIEASGRKPELFHLAEDPQERHDRSVESPQTLAAMARRLKQIRALEPAAPGAEPPANPGLVEELRALGYI